MIAETILYNVLVSGKLPEFPRNVPLVLIEEPHLVEGDTVTISVSLGTRLVRFDIPYMVESVNYVEEENVWDVWLSIIEGDERE